MVKIIFDYIASLLVENLPKFISDRIYDKNKLEKDVEIQVRGQGEPATIYSQSKSIPTIELWLEIINKSPYRIPFKLESAIVDIWFSQPFCRLIYLKSKNIERGNKKTIVFKEFLNSYQIAELKKLNPSHLRIYSTFNFSSKIGDFEKKYDTEGISVKIY